MSPTRTAGRLGALVLAMLIVTMLALACESGGAPGPREAAPAKAPKPGGPAFVRGPTGDAPIAPFVRERIQRAAPSGKVLVYVGAPWCEPCRRFHEAVESGRLDAVLPDVELVEFDLDVDRDALTAAGCVSRLIPLFAVPNDAGLCSDRRLSGSIKGPEAVDENLVPRLIQLLSDQPVQ